MNPFKMCIVWLCKLEVWIFDAELIKESIFSISIVLLAHHDKPGGFVRMFVHVMLFGIM